MDPAIDHEPSAISHQPSSVSYFDGERRLCGCEARHRDPIRRCAHVIETDRLEKMNRCGIAAVLAANPELQVRTCFASKLHAHPHERTDTLGIDRCEGVALENFLVLINPQELADVVPRKAKRELSEIVGAE